MLNKCFVSSISETPVVIGTRFIDEICWVQSIFMEHFLTQAFFAYVAWACYKHLKLTQTQNVPERTYYGNGEEAEVCTLAQFLPIPFII